MDPQGAFIYAGSLLVLIMTMRFRLGRHWLVFYLHASLISIPCALLGLYCVFWMSLGARNVESLALTGAWVLVSSLALCFMFKLTNAWQKDGAAGVQNSTEPLTAMPLVSAMQAVLAICITASALGKVVLFLPVSIALGAPWLSLFYHLRWLARANDEAQKSGCS